MKPTILFEDVDILVVDKPAGLQVIPDTHKERETLDVILKEKYGEIHIVHRIDRETSGVLVVARNEEAYEFLKNQFKNREVQKTYRAFVYGTLPERGVIDKPIGSTRGGSGPRSAKKPYGQLRDATTIYRRLETGAEASYIEVYPKTGRTHQIRVHMASIQHPIVSDTLYARNRPSLLGFGRLALHALSLVLVHPKGQKMTFEAPLPPDFLEAEAKLRKS